MLTPVNLLVLTPTLKDSRKRFAYYCGHNNYWEMQISVDMDELINNTIQILSNCRIKTYLTTVDHEITREYLDFTLAKLDTFQDEKINIKLISQLVESINQYGFDTYNIENNDKTSIMKNLVVSMYLYKIGKIDESIEWATKKRNFNSKIATDYLVDFLWKVHSDKSLKALQKVIFDKDIITSTMLKYQGFYYLYGINIEQDTKLALKCFKDAIINDDKQIIPIIKEIIDRKSI